MLALVRRTGTEFGIAVIVASHLLGEIERVCDFLVAIDAGRLLRAAPLGSFTERTGVLAVEVEEGESELAAALVARGLQAVADGRTVLVAIEDDRPYDLVRDAIADLGLPLVRLQQRRQRLEDLFSDEPPAEGRRVIGRQGGRRRVQRAPRGPGGSIYDLGYQGYEGPRLGQPECHRGALLEHASGVLRDRSGRAGEDRPFRARCADAPARRDRGRHRGPRGAGRGRG